MPPKGAKGEKKRQAAKAGPRPTPKNLAKVKKVALKVNSKFVNPYEGAKHVDCKSCGQCTADPERQSEDSVGNPQHLNWHKAGLKTSIAG